MTKGSLREGAVTNVTGGERGANGLMFLWHTDFIKICVSESLVPHSPSADKIGTSLPEGGSKIFSSPVTNTPTPYFSRRQHTAKASL